MVFFVVVGALLAGPKFFQGLFPFFAILNTLDFVGIMLIEYYPCSSNLLVDWMYSKYQYLYKLDYSNKVR